ncbi:MAG TPA: pyridoxal-phosphate dependent enzyme, partial [Thermoanaerobaculaceae bacterium]|nr:pyridoxal-phosphate dependent enzyme [Thermoanaerobaculaceae bacterium]
RVRAELGARPLVTRDAPGILAFEPLLPVVGLAADYAGDVGRTPALRSGRLSDELGAAVFVKNEAANPSGSFKDRGLAVGVALGVVCGARRFCLPTQGNAGVAACLFSARAGLPGALIYMPEGFEGGVYHRACEQFGGEVRFFGPNIAAAGRRMREDVREELARGELVDISTFFEPGRLEGKKTMGLEIALAFAGKPLPEFVVYPTGGGTGLVGIWKALTELGELGLLEPAHGRLPRMVAVQSEQCAPVVESFLAGRDAVTPVTSRGTIADGLDVPAAIMGHGMLRVLRESGGTAVAVSEAEIRAAFARFGAAGIAAGYESAATLAALARLRRDGTAPEGASALLLATGSHLIPLGAGHAAHAGEPRT